MEQPFISVVMPTYNSAKYVKESIESILNQTYHNFEFIIVDGHSTDGTIKIIENYCKTDARVRLLFDEKKGIGAALRYGCEHAKGDFIARMDSDDIALPGRFKEEVNYLLNHKNVVLVSCSAIYINEVGENMGYSFPYTWQYWLKKDVRTILHPGVMMRRDSYIKAGGYPCLIRVEDNLLWKRLRKEGTLHIIEYPLVKYRIINESLTNSMPSEFWGMFEQYIQPYIEINSLTEIEYEEINSFIKKHIVKNRTTYFGKRINPIENSLLRYLKIVIPERFAFKIVFLIKNIYGIFKDKR